MCSYTNLSDSFYFKVVSKRDKIVEEYSSSCLITLNIFKISSDKKNQTIFFHSPILFDTVFKDCGFIKSYSKNVNLEKEVIDNDYGDFIVADFNFDGQDDFAIKNNSGGNSGPTYYYYIQNKDGIFVKDSYLSEKMEYFPMKIDKENKLLVTLVHLSAVEQSEMTYSYNDKTKSWTRIKHDVTPYY
jgi:hypothetical protein